MRQRNWGWVAALVVLVSAGASRAMVLCDDGDTILFSCTIKKGGKIVSVCLKGKNGMMYRFGKRGAVELEYPGTPGAGADGFTFHREPYPDGTEYTVAFSKGDTAYTVYDQMSNNSSPSYGWVSVDRGGKNLAKLDCGPNMSEGFEGLDQLAPSGMKIAPSDSPPAAAPAAPAAAPGLVCDEGVAHLEGYRKQVGQVFRNYSEKKHIFYAFAVKQFGPPQSCAMAMDASVPSTPGPNTLDENTFNGMLTYQFKGATLVMTSRGGINAHLTAPDGFKDVAAAKRTLAKAAEVDFKSDGPPEKIDDAAAGTHTDRYTSGSGESEQGSLVTKGGKLIAIDCQY